METRKLMPFLLQTRNTSGVPLDYGHNEAHSCAMNKQLSQNVTRRLKCIQYEKLQNVTA